MDDQSTQSEPVADTSVQAPEPASAPVEPESSQPDGSTPTDLPPEAPESPISDSTPIPVESDNSGVNESFVVSTPQDLRPESDGSEPAQDASQTLVDDDLTASPTSESVQPVPDQPTAAPVLVNTVASQSQSLVQQDQVGFIHSLLIKAQVKIQFNKKKKLDRIVQFAQKKQIIANEDIQKLLHVSSATATRYLVKLVEQGRFARVGNPRDAKYQFLR
jgi:hypothetical protein